MDALVAAISSNSTVIAAIFSSSIVTSLFTIFANQYLTRRKEEGLTKVKALDMAVRLEGFAIQCADGIHDAKVNKDVSGNLISFSKIPKPPKLDITSNYLSGKKKATLTNEILCFPQEVIQANQFIDFYIDVVGDHEAAAHASIQKARELGLNAIDLSAKLRQVYKLPERELIFGSYNVTNSLRSDSNN